MTTPRKARVGDFALGSEGILACSRMLWRRLSSTLTSLDKRSYSGVEAKERLEEEDAGCEGDGSELGNMGRCLREGTGGNSCDGGDVSGGVTIDRENEDLREREGRSTSFRREGRIPVLSVIPLGRVCGRGPSETLLFDRPWVVGIVAESGLEVDGLGAETSFIDTFRVRGLDRAASKSDCVL